MTEPVFNYASYNLFEFLVPVQPILILEKAFKKVLMTRNAWANMSLGDDGMDFMEESASFGKACYFKIVRKVNMGDTKPDFLNSAALEELREKLEASVQEIDIIKDIKEGSCGYDAYQKAQDSNQDTSQEVGCFSISEYNKTLKTYTCHHCSL